MMATLRDLGGRLACIIFTHPLTVVKIRSIAQFIGQESQHRCGRGGGTMSGVAEGCSGAGGNLGSFL